jgi:uncharacterized protein (DUF1501 family)
MSFGRTFRFVGAGKVRGGRCPLPGAGCGAAGGVCGVWATVATAKMAAANRDVAAREIEGVFKRRFSSWIGMTKGIDEILPKKASLSD